MLESFCDLLARLLDNGSPIEELQSREVSKPYIVTKTYSIKYKCLKLPAKRTRKYVCSVIVGYVIPTESNSHKANSLRKGHETFLGHSSTKRFLETTFYIFKSRLANGLFNWSNHVLSEAV